jgi:DNA-directed RNA polymerase subunit RPC12/RpoP
MAQIIEYKCPCCSGIIEFDSKTQKMVCPYCDTVFDPKALMEKDEALNNAAPDNMNWDNTQETWTEEESENMNVYSCRSCGGEIVAEATMGATHCPFCGNPVVLTSRFAGALKPDLVIPFKLSKEEAKDALKRFMSKKKLLPKLFSTENHLEEIKGVYVPFWLFSADADTTVNFHATRTRMWRDSKMEYTETSHFRLEREGVLGFQNVPVDGSSQMEDDLMESIEPYDLSEAEPFQTAYLSGFYANRYDVSAEESAERANNRIRKTAVDAVSGTVSGYISAVPETSSVQLRNQSRKYALYPVWLLNTNYNGKSYHFAMNGQTGRFVGDMPVGKQEFWKWFAIYGGIASVVIWLLLQLFFVS